MSHPDPVYWTGKLLGHRAALAARGIRSIVRRLVNEKHMHAPSAFVPPGNPRSYPALSGVHAITTEGTWGSVCVHQWISSERTLVACCAGRSEKALRSSRLCPMLVSFSLGGTLLPHSGGNKLSFNPLLLSLSLSPFSPPSLSKSTY